MGALKQERVKLSDKLIAADRAHQSAEAGLKNVEMQVEDQCKQLHMTKIELAIQRQLVLDLKAELEKAKDTAQVAREASEAMETTSYERGVLETETRLAEEVVGVCKDYCAETWVEALNRAEVPEDSELKKAESVFFLEDIREAPVALPLPMQLPTIQAPSPDAKVSAGAGKGKEVQPSAKAKQFKDALTIRDVVSKAKETESKSKAADPEENPPQAKA